jgi:RNA polymerase sigma factor (sigma-70 family)
MSNDAELLGWYVRERSEPAFTELVNRHVNLVFSAALRETAGDAASAEDLTQAVFTELARQAAKLTRHPVLAGWLYTTVRLLAANWRRSRHRREQRELAAHAMNAPDLTDATGPAWEEIAPVLDDAMHELREADRAALVLRFFENRSLREVGAALGLSENAARMRVDRALDKLRDQLARRGVTSTAAALGTALAAGAVIPAPAGLAAGVAATALASATVISNSATLNLMNLMNLTKTQIAIAGACLVTAVAVPVWQQTRINRLTARTQELSEQAGAAAQFQTDAARLRGNAATDAAELDRLRKAENELKVEVARLRNELGTLKRATGASPAAAAPVAGAPAPDKPALPAVMTAAMKAAIEQQTVGKLNRLKPRLNLTPEQEEAIRTILTRQAERATSAAEKMFAGKLSREEMAALDKGSPNPEEEILAVLTPEQVTAYQEFKQEENVSNSRLVANAELLQMQTQLGLTQEQQDKVFNALYDYTLETLSGKIEGGPPKSAEPAAALAWQLERKFKALEGVLTPEQLAGYREMQEKQMKLVEGLLPKAAGNAGR